MDERKVFPIRTFSDTNNDRGLAGSATTARTEAGASARTPFGRAARVSAVRHFVALDLRLSVRNLGDFFCADGSLPPTPVAQVGGDRCGPRSQPPPRLPVAEGRGFPERGVAVVVPGGSGSGRQGEEGEHTKHQINTKHQSFVWRRAGWCFGFGVYLVFGVWNLVFSFPCFPILFPKGAAPR